MTNTVVFVANRGYALTSSRIPLIKRFIESGWKVVIATADDAESQSLVDLGVVLQPVYFSRGGVAFAQDISAYKQLLNIYNKWKPSLIHHFHAKPVILGTLVARRLLGSSVSIVNTITGLGHAFINGGWIAKLAGFGYKFALPKSNMTIFQNNDDYALFLSNRWVNHDSTKVIASSGVDIAKFAFVDRSIRDGDSPVVIMLGRLLRQKGILEFAEVAERVQMSLPKARFLLAGEEDLVHPDSLSIESIQNYDGVEYLGRLDDVLPLLEMADLLLFPSYREGVPRAVLEAAATGLPTIGYEVPGVKEAVVNNLTGYLIHFNDVDALYERTIELLNDKKLRLTMGKAASERAKKSFDRREIENMYIKTYQELGVSVT